MIRYFKKAILYLEEAVCENTEKSLLRLQLDENLGEDRIVPGRPVLVVSAPKQWIVVAAVEKDRAVVQRIVQPTF